MKTGHILAILGVLGIAAGAGMYLIDYHRTIGLGGIGLGVVLVLIGLWAGRSMKPAAAPQATQPTPAQ